MKLSKEMVVKVAMKDVQDFSHIHGGEFQIELEEKASKAFINNKN